MKLTHKWESLTHEYASKLRALDEAGEGDALKKAMDEAGEAAGKLVEFGYEMAHDLDTVRDDLFSKWWFKLFTKLGL